MAVAALAVASCSPGREKEGTGEGEKGTCWHTLQSHSVISISVSVSIIFFFSEEQTAATIAIINFLLTGLGQLQDGVQICSQACRSRTQEGEATVRDGLFLGGCQEPKRSEQTHRGL